MQYRPEYHLDQFRMTLEDSTSSNGRRERDPLLHVRWLRTMVVDLSHTAERDVDTRLTHYGVVGCAVERVVCKGMHNVPLSRLLPFLTQSVPMLTLLDLRGVMCDVEDNSFLSAVANAHSSSLRRLYLPWNSRVSQSTLERFTQLEELDATWCQHLTNVNFCSATLRVLYANDCVKLTDAGLRNATRLEVLHVVNCKRVTDVSPFAHCLLELNASSSNCGIGSAALSDCHRLQVLNSSSNSKITTLHPFAPRLRELKAAYCSSALNDAALADATGLVSLMAEGNQAITTVEPFGASLRCLVAHSSMIGDAGLVTATNLVCLNASDNDNIRSLAPFSASLLELDVSGEESAIDDAALSAATNLFWLNVSHNRTITTLQSCGRSLRHLYAGGKGCALNEGVSTATQLLTLYSSANLKLTKIKAVLADLPLGN